MIVLLIFPVITKYITIAKTAKTTSFVSITSLELYHAFPHLSLAIPASHNRYLKMRNAVAIIPPSITGFNMEDKNSEKVNVLFL